MEAFNDILTSKLKFMNSYKDLKLSNIELKKLLLQERRRQIANQIVQAKLTQNLIIKKIVSPYQIEQFYEASLNLMKIYDREYQPQDKTEDMYNDIVYLYVKFFDEHNCQLRAQQINHLYTKSLCQKNLLLATIYFWFTQWVRKKFSAFMKFEIGKLQYQSRLNQLLQKQKQSNKNSSQKVGSKFRQKLEMLSPTQFYQKEQQTNVLEQNLKVLRKVANRIRSISSNKKTTMSMIQQWPKDQSLIMNRQIMLGGFYQQISLFYKTNMILQDIDLSYLRSIRRNERKQQFKLKIDYIVYNLAKNQQVKKFIDDYAQKYQNRVQKILKNDKIRENNTLSPKKRLLEEEKASYTKETLKKNNKKISRRSYDKLNIIEEQKRLPEIQRQRRTLELKVPQLIYNGQQSIQFKNKRYSKGRQLKNFLQNRNKQKKYLNQQQNLSKQIKDEIQQMNNIFSDQKTFDKQQYEKFACIQQTSSSAIQKLKNLQKVEGSIDRKFKYFSRKSAILQSSSKKRYTSKFGDISMELKYQPKNPDLQQYINSGGVFCFPKISKQLK